MARTVLWAVGMLGAVCVGGCWPTARVPERLPPPAGPQLPLDVILTTATQGDPWWGVVTALQESEGAPVVRLQADSPESILPSLRKLSPQHAILVLPPDDLDVNFAWRWLSVASRLDDDPFVDLYYGVITGATPDDALAFWKRIREAERDPTAITPRLLDCLGPNQLNNDRVVVHRQLFWAGWLRGKIDARGMNNGLRGFADRDLGRLTGYGILHLGGHGYPDRIDQGLTAAQLARARLSPSLAFNGACSTGVTSRAFEMANGRWVERTYAPEQSFCLTMLKQPVVGYLAATHPDHGVPVYQEMEHWLTTGCTLGEVIKHTYDAVVVANGGRRPDFPVLKGGEPMPAWSPQEVMLYGTASRLLFGDPRLRLCGPVNDPALRVHEPVGTGDVLSTIAMVANPDVGFSLMDTFESDMATQTNGFNDRVYMEVLLPPGVQVADVTADAIADGKPVTCRVVGYAVEEWGRERRLHAQVDLPSTGYQRGPIRTKAATVTLTIRAASPSAAG